MGQTLSEPVKEKHSDKGSDKRIIYASSAMQGWRISMEDAHTAELTLKDKIGYSFFGVYDGHGGQNVAKYSGAHLHERIARDPLFPSNLEDAIKNGFLGTDEDLKNDPQYANDPSGCTAVTAVMTPENWIFVGNAGDSRAVMSKDGDALPMSIDHKPLNKDESSRIQKAGGFVEFGRVNGNLALSRAIGDFEFKQNPNLSPEEQIVTAYPDVKKEQIIRDKTEFLVLACDGIWDCLSSQQVVNFIRRDIAQSKSLQTACENLMERCLAKDSELGGIGCDNMTVIIVGFLNGKNENEWYDWMASRYGNVGPVYDEEFDKQKGHDMSTDYNEDDADEGLEIPSEQADEYLPDDNDLENQNELTIDDIPHRRESTDSGISSRSNSADSVSKIVIDNNKEKKNDNDAVSSPISNTPQSQKSPNNNTDNNSSAESTPVYKSATEGAVNSVSSDGKETGKNPYNTWPGSKK